MASQRTDSVERRRVIIFGGQGSSSLFSSAATSSAQDDAKSSVAAAVLLSHCHDAFLKDCLSLDLDSRQKTGVDPSSFHELKDFIAPPQRFHNNAIIQATTICLYQLLHYLVEIARRDLDFDTSKKQILETTGFSSGLLSATVVATSSTIGEYVSFGVEAFRLAFWIACRTNINGHEFTNTRDPMGSWSLVVLGVPQVDMQAKLNEFHEQTNRRNIRISAILSATVVSLSGPNRDLHAFSERLGATAATKFAHVYAWYHGGKQLESIVDEVVQDIEQQKIEFPNFEKLQMPLRSTLDGSILDAEASNDSLAHWVLRHILLYPVDWFKTSQNITEAMANQGSVVPQLLSFGPSSESLFMAIKPNSVHPRFELHDLSSFQSRGLSSNQDGIAIVGLGVHFPKGEGDAELWETLSKGLSVISEIPESRFKISQYYSPKESTTSRQMSTRHGAFLDDVWKFDHAFFNISPREARSMDPQQRILLHTAQAALEDAGYVRDSTPSSKAASTGCYIGIATGDYTDNLRNDIDVFYSPGTLRAFNSGRLSFVHKLGGPSIVTDTACSSSLVSIYHACRAIQHGDCTTALAGGVNVMSSPDMYLGLSRGHFLSPTGGCKPFDASADGYCRAEGCGVFILKRVSDAIAENDRIHAIIKGVEVNQNGNAHSITHPHSKTQIELFERLFRKANVEPASISVVEAHGTGTQAGDFSEVASLRTVFEKSHSMDHPLVISSIKGNIGHCEAASGAAGLAKLLLMLRKKELLKQANFTSLNPRLTGLENAGLVIPTENRSWQHSNLQPRRALLNNFGAAGSNAALILEERTETPRSGDNRASYVFNLSAKSQDTLQASIQQIREFLSQSLSRLSDICYTASARRQVYEYRVSVPVSSINDLQTKLGKINVKTIEPSELSKGMVFVFSGQGSLYSGMGYELMNTSFFFKNQILRCDAIVQGLGFPSFLSFLDKNTKSISVHDEIVMSQCACVALEYSLAKLFMSWNVVPDYVSGHSLGEFAALAVSDALSLEDILRVVATRAQMITKYCAAGSSGMLACKMSPSKADKILECEATMSLLNVACRNTDVDCVVSGPWEQLAHFEKVCKHQNVKLKKLEVPYGFHSSSMDPIVEPLRKLSSSLTWKQPTIPVASNVFGRLLDIKDVTSSYFAHHVRQSVRFGDSIQDISEKGGFRHSVCMEIGPHPVILPMIRGILAKDYILLSTLQKNQDAWLSINATLSQLSLIKNDISWRAVFEGSQAKMTSMPRYPLSKTAFMVPYREHSTGFQSAPLFCDTGLDLLPRSIASQSSDDTILFETTITVLEPLISGHNVGGFAICPASVYHELFLEAASKALSVSDNQFLTVSNMTFVSALVHEPSQEARPIYVHVSKSNIGDSVEVKLTVGTSEDPKASLCCKAVVSIKSAMHIKSRWLKESAMVKRQCSYFNEANRHSRFQTKHLYETIFPRVVRYSKEYQSLIELSVSDSNLEGIGSFKLPQGVRIEGYVVTPGFTDTLLHAAGFIANLSVRSDEICICSKVESIEVLYNDIDFSETFTIYCSLLDVIKGSILADAFAVNSFGNVVAVVRSMEFKKIQLTSLHRLLKSSASPDEKMQFVEDEKSLSKSSRGSSSPTCVATPTSPDNNRHSVSKTLFGILSDASGFSEQDLNASKFLAELGIDSMMKIEIASKLKQVFPESAVDHHSLTECDTVQALHEALVSALKNSDDDVMRRLPNERNGELNEDEIDAFQNWSLKIPQDRNPAVLRTSHSKAAPLYLFHDGSGQVSVYAKMLKVDRTLHAFFDPDFATQKRLVTNLTQMAERYCSYLSKSRTPALIVGGWSFGGVVAFEAARQLKLAGFDVKGLVLIDSPCPRKHQPLPREIISSILDKPYFDNRVRTDLLDEFHQNAALLGKYSPPSSSPIKTVMLRSRDTLDTDAMCGVTYEWLNSQKTRDDAIKGWEQIVGGRIEVLEISGNHFQAFAEPNIVETTSQLMKSCRIIEEEV